MSIPARLVIIACWIVFLGFWLVTAGATKDVAHRESAASRLGYTLPLMAGAVLLFRGFGNKAYPWGAGRHLLPALTTLAWTGAALTILGLALALWARVTLGRNWSAAVMVRKDHELIMRGPYALSRHPIYTAMLLMFIGTVLAIGTLEAFAGFLLIAASLWIKLGQEERLMMRQFPDEYPAYRQRVKRLIPYIW
jgi:protein-S-isoprenylcysteine O-methyltransferase Ste14